jgi:hypothetical protein
MLKTGSRWLAVAFCSVVVCGAGSPVSANASESQRLERAKDLIAEEQWLRAIAELRAAAADPKESEKDEALFWLAHSQNQAGQFAAALETIGRLEQAHRASRWMRPAQSLRLEIAQRLGRTDVLWYTARLAPPAPPPPPGPKRPANAPPPPPPPPTPPGLPASPAEPPRILMARPGASGFSTAWVAEQFTADLDLRVQALGSLIRTDAAEVIPILKEIALDGQHPGPARRALFVLAQSGRPEARSTVIEVARSGSEPARIAAVRELGRLQGPGVANELLEVYTSGNAPVRYQVVTALGERAAITALLRIAQDEPDVRLREAAITTLGTAGGREQLNVLYASAGTEMKRAVLAGFLNARADEDLIRIARRDRDPAVRREAVAKLRVLATPRALEFLKTLKEQ